MIPLDRLVLGTVKFGLGRYGYGSTSCPSAAESIAILRHAWRRGVRAYDTALGYGDAFYLLAEAGIPGRYIVSKCRLPLAPTVMANSHDRSWLIHNPTAAEMLAGLIPAQHGVSVYTIEEIATAYRLNIAPIQAPASCLNPDPGPVTFGRAPFLQGVLLRPAYLAPEPLREAVSAFQLLCLGKPFTPLELALHAAYGERIVFGVSSIGQLEDVLLAAERDVSPLAIAEARELAATVDATAALPSLWSKP